MNRRVLAWVGVVQLCLAGAVFADENAKDVIDVAVASKDHTTLVAAVKAADLVMSLKNAGPFTVFAPTNAAFDKLPKGTVEGLLKPEKKFELEKILQYHVTTSALQLKDFKDGELLGMASGSKTTLAVTAGKVTINGANILASIPVSNGMVYVIDAVLIAPPKPEKKKP
jgi:uncharacterized surface protein with fasciclin (FAS1) repeats